MEIILIGAAALLIFGPRRLPELAKGLGKGIRDFKKALDGSDEEHDSSTKSSTSASAASHDALPPGGTIAKQSTADPVKAKVPGSDDSRS